MKHGKHGVENSLIIWFGLAYLIVIMMFALSYSSARRLRESEVFWLEHGYQIIAEVETSYGSLREAESRQRTYLVNSEESFLRSLKIAGDKFRAQIDQLESLTANNPGQLARVKQFEALGIERLNLLQTQIRMKRAGDMEAIKEKILDGSGRQKMAEVYALKNEIRREEESLLAERRAESEAGARNSVWSLAALGAAVMATLAMAYIFISREIIGRKRTEEELRSLNEELEERVAIRTKEIEASNKELEAFSYSVSHDLRAPLRHVTSFANLLREHAAASIDETSENYLRRIIEAANGMGRLIDGLLVFSRLGRVEMSRDKVNLNQLTEEALQELQSEIQDREIIWRIGEMPVVEGNRETLRAALVNLLSNAIKFTRHQRPAHIEIGCGGAVDGETVCFVRDNGVGFDMRYANKLFGVFQRLHRARDFEGTGIGLANVRRIILRHGGRIWAESELGRGATFYFSLPLRTAALGGSREESAQSALHTQMA